MSNIQKKRHSIIGNIFSFLTGRLFLVGMAILVQFVALILLVGYISQYGIYVYTAFTIFSVVTIFFIVGKDDNPIYKLAWVIPVALLPVLGWFIYYLLDSKSKMNKKQIEQAKIIYNDTKDLTHQSKDVLNDLKQQSMQNYLLSSYLNNTAYLPIYTNTETEYLSPGEVFWERLLIELKKAQKFIFMEYFILQEGKMLSAIIDILAQKVNEGVEVYFMYDDLGCINTLPYNYHKKLEALGIKVRVFNKLKPSLDMFVNYRDHRKITVIDGNVGFMGGNNLADEYINYIEKHGHWKDSSLMLKGSAVDNLSVLFLQMWQYKNLDKVDYNAFLTAKPVVSSGFVQPFGDGPLDNHLIGEVSYIKMISNATRYVSITTPYLIIDNEMLETLRNAALSGVSVRIITPGVADKWYVHLVTQYNYKSLIEAGVKIYEYTAGFMHAKTIVCDDSTAIVGTQNFDFRSFYLHFECGTFMYNTKACSQVVADHSKIIACSKELTLADCKKGFFTSAIQVVLNLFAPLL